MYLLPPANEVWGKAIFLHLSVILFTGGYLGRYTPQAGTHPMGRYTPLGRHTPRQVHPPDRYPPTPGRYPPEQCTLGAGGMEYILVEYWFPKKNQ